MTSEVKPEIFPEAELSWFRRVVNYRLLEGYAADKREDVAGALPSAEQELLLKAESVTDLLPPDLSEDSSTYAWLVQRYKLTMWERFVLILALVPHLRPQLLDALHVSGLQTKYGGIKNGAVYIPSGETALFILADGNLTLRFELLKLFDERYTLRKASFIQLEAAAKNEPEWSGALVPSHELLDLVTRGYVRPPEFSSDFPAKRITTDMTWDDLILPVTAQRQIGEVKVWLRHQEEMMNLGLNKRLKPGYKVLFYGSPGTGKTLTACLLGQYTDKHVFRIDLSMIVSKYIGETEKNLAKVFDKAEHSGWILFFDEADALFGARTKVSSSNDRYANQQISYLLQRIEDYPGIVILATNMKSNIDDAFARRFQSVVHFPFPKTDERILLWKKALPERLSFAADVDMKQLADRYEISGANITNIVAWCALMALDKGDMLVTERMLRDGVARELAKEGRTL